MLWIKLNTMFESCLLVGGLQLSGSVSGLVLTPHRIGFGLEISRLELEYYGAGGVCGG